MKKVFGFLCTILLFLCLADSALALSLYVDAAPNIYGSPDYAPWKNDAFAKAANGTFTNMANGINGVNDGTTNFEIQDGVVYSFGDLGKRLTFIYWVPGETIKTLTGNFQVSLLNTWDGVQSDIYKDYYDEEWLTPSSWVDYDSDGDGQTDGVIGTGGNGWWGAYGVNTQAALDADIAQWIKIDETYEFRVRLNDEVTSITAYREGVAPVPEPATMLLLGSGIIGLAGFRKKFKKS